MAWATGVRGGALEPGSHAQDLVVGRDHHGDAPGHGAGLVERDVVDVDQAEERVAGPQDHPAAGERRQAGGHGDRPRQPEGARAGHHEHGGHHLDAARRALEPAPPSQGDASGDEGADGEHGRQPVGGGRHQAAVDGGGELPRHPRGQGVAAHVVHADPQGALDHRGPGDHQVAGGDGGGLGLTGEERHPDAALAAHDATVRGDFLAETHLDDVPGTESVNGHHLDPGRGGAPGGGGERRRERGGGGGGGATTARLRHPPREQQRDQHAQRVEVPVDAERRHHEAVEVQRQDGDADGEVHVDHPGLQALQGRPVERHGGPQRDGGGQRELGPPEQRRPGLVHAAEPAGVHGHGQQHDVGRQERRHAEPGDEVAVERGLGVDRPGPVPERGDALADLGERGDRRVPAHGGAAGGVADVRVADAGGALQEVLDHPHARGAGEAVDGEAALVAFGPGGDRDRRPVGAGRLGPGRRRRAGGVPALEPRLGHHRRRQLAGVAAERVDGRLHRVAAVRAMRGRARQGGGGDHGQRSWLWVYVGSTSGAVAMAT
jgi:hypothetical protein